MCRCGQTPGWPSQRSHQPAWHPRLRRHSSNLPLIGNERQDNRALFVVPPVAIEPLLEFRGAPPEAFASPYAPIAPLRNAMSCCAANQYPCNSHVLIGDGTGVPSSYTMASPLSFQPWFLVPSSIASGIRGSHPRLCRHTYGRSRECAARHSNVARSNFWLQSRNTSGPARSRTSRGSGSPRSRRSMD
jgi:hypothetical protein